MSKKNGMFSTILQKDGDKLIYHNPAEQEIYNVFVKALQDGTLVEVFFDANTDDGTIAQISKLHKCIREIAKETGDSFDDIKEYVKKRSGFIIEKEVLGEIITKKKSFGKASKDDLSLAIETCINLGDFLQMQLR